MFPFWCNIEDRLQDKAPLFDAGVRQGQWLDRKAGWLAEKTVVVQQIQVECARPPAFQTFAPCPPLYHMECAHQDLRRQCGFDAGDRVDEIGLVHNSKRCGFDEARDRQYTDVMVPHFSQGPQHRVARGTPWTGEIAAQSDENHD